MSKSALLTLKEKEVDGLIEKSKRFKKHAEEVENFSATFKQPDDSFFGGAEIEINETKEGSDLEIEVMVMEDGAVYHPDGVIKYWYDKGMAKSIYENFIKSGEKQIVNMGHKKWIDNPDAGDIGEVIDVRFETFGDDNDKGRLYATLKLDREDNFVKKMIRRSKENEGVNLYSISSQIKPLDMYYDKKAGQRTKVGTKGCLDGLAIVAAPAMPSAYGAVKGSDLMNNSVQEVSNIDILKDLSELIQLKKLNDKFKNDNDVSSLKQYLELIDLNINNSMSTEVIVKNIEDKIKEMEEKQDNSQTPVLPDEKQEVDTKAETEVEPKEVKQETEQKEPVIDAQQEDLGNSGEPTEVKDTQKEKEEEPETNRFDELTKKLESLESKLSEIKKLEEQNESLKSELEREKENSDSKSQKNQSLEVKLTEFEERLKRIDTAAGSTAPRVVTKAPVKTQDQGHPMMSSFDSMINEF